MVETPLLLFLMNTLPNFTSSPLLAIMYGSQIYKTVKTKNVEGISLWFFPTLSLILLFSMIAQIISFLLYGTGGLLIKETINFVPAVVMTYLVFKYKDNGKSEVKGEWTEKQSQN